MRPDEIPDMLAALSETCGWALTNTESLLLRGAIAAHDRTVISDTARRLKRTLLRRVEPADLANALNARTTNSGPTQPRTSGFHEPITDDERSHAREGIAAARARIRPTP